MSKQDASPVVNPPGDEVLVAHALDHARARRSIFMGLAFRFNEVLDCDKVHHALARLLETGGWRKLGGRLRLNKKTGHIEIHVPQKFTSGRPAVHYSHITYDMDLDEHPRLRDHFPRPSDDPSIQSGYAEYVSLLEPADGNPPHSLQDYFQSDHPQISLHAASFRDATLLCVKIPHFTTDIMGWHHLLQNWSLVLAGREDEVRPLGGFEEDITERIAQLSIPDKSSPSFKHGGHKQLTGLGMLLFVLRILWALLFGPKVVHRAVFLPAKTMQILREEATRHTEDHSSPNTSSETMLSDANILTAWAAKLTLSSLSRETPNKMSQNAAIMTVVDMRRRCPSIFSPPDETISKGRLPVYVQNLDSVAMSNLPLKDVLEQPLGITASQIRHSITPQLSEGAISEFIRHIRAIPGRTAVFAGARDILLPVSNWTCARLFDLDFSAAVTDTDNDVGLKHFKALPGRPVSIAPMAFNDNPHIRNFWAVTGRDAQGNYWLQATCSDAAWAVVRKELERLKVAAASS